MKAVFRVDAGRVRGLSFGHIYRCLTLARMLREQHGASSTAFLMRDLPHGPDLARQHGETVHLLAAETDPASERAALDAAGGDLLVIDLPDIVRLGAGPLQTGARRCTVIDDAGQTIPPSDAIVNGGICAGPGMYAGVEAEIHTGPAYCVMDADVPTPRRDADTSDGPLRVLVSFGGSDPTGLTPQVADALTADAPAIHLDIVLGPGYPHDGLDERLAGRPGVSVHRHVASVPGMLAAADAAVLTGGMTAYQAAAVGCPAVYIPSISHEEPVTRAFAAAGAGIDLGGFDAARLRTVIADLVEDAPARQTMSAAGPGIVDGQGAARVADRIAARW